MPGVWLAIGDKIRGIVGGSSGVGTSAGGQVVRHLRRVLRALAPWARVLVAAGVTAGAALVGWHLRPPNVPIFPDLSGPAIMVLADQPHFRATVNITMDFNGVPGESFINRRGKQGPIPAGLRGSPYELDVGINTLKSVTSPVKLIIVFQGFPAAVSSDLEKLTRLTPTYSLPPPSYIGPLAGYNAGNGSGTDFITTEEVYPNYPPSHKPYEVPGIANVDLFSRSPISMAIEGPQLRLNFPQIVAVTSPSADLGLDTSTGYPTNAMFKGSGNLPELPHLLYQPYLVAGKSNFHFISDLINYQVISGNLPTITANDGWTWTGASSVNVLAQNNVAVDAEQRNLFWAGILLGLAGAGLMATALELIAVLQAPTKRSGRKGRKPQRRVVSHGPPTRR